MVSTSLPRCDCCGEDVQPGFGDTCPICGYPVDAAKEEQFLITSLRDLNRIITYGGARLSIMQLVARYQLRLRYLTQLRSAAVAPSGQGSAPTVVLNKTPLPVRPGVPMPPPPGPAQFIASPVPPLRNVPVPSQMSPAVPPAPRSVAAPPPISQPAGQVFSFKTFFADQTINIVASLGACKNYHKFATFDS